MLKVLVACPDDVDVIFRGLLTTPFTPLTPLGLPLSFDASLGRPLAWAAIVVEDCSSVASSSWSAMVQL